VPSVFLLLATSMAVLTFIKSTWPERIRSRHAEMDAATGN
jgi:hypothetical protein